MADEVKNETSEQEQVTIPPVKDPFNEESWVEQPVKSEVPAPTEQVNKDVPHGTENKETIVEPFYKKLGFEKEDDVVAEITTLREKAAKAPEEKQFADEQSKHIYELLREGGDKKKEVRKFLETQEKLETLVSAEVNEDTSVDIIKLGLRLKYKDLTDKEIDYKYNKQYSIPKEPIKGELEDDDEFAEKHAAWKETVDDIKTSRIIDAKTMRPELEKAKSELVLPEIQKGNQNLKQEPTPEDLAVFEKDKTTFLQSAEQSINSFNGVTVQVKDKDVDYTVNYAPSQDEKTLVTTKLKEFAEAQFDANAIFADRWVTEDGKMNVSQMTEDLSRILMGKNSDQKLATDSANKRLEAYLKDKKQINVNETNQNGQLNLEKDNTSETVKVQEFFWNQS